MNTPVEGRGGGKMFIPCVWPNDAIVVLSIACNPLVAVIVGALPGAGLNHRRRGDVVVLSSRRLPGGDRFRMGSRTALLANSLTVYGLVGASLAICRGHGPGYLSCSLARLRAQNDPLARRHAFFPHTD